MTLRFHYDVVCPYAYLASTRIGALAAEAGVPVEWCPVLLGGIFRAVGAPQRPGDLAPAAKARLDHLDALRRAELLGVPLAWPTGHPVRTVDAMRLLTAAEGEARIALTGALGRAYWVDGRDLSDHRVLAEIAAPYGLDPDEVSADARVRRGLFEATDRAVAAGAFGVPTFEVDGRLFWGIDRLPRVREVLGLPPEPRVTGGVGGKRVVFFHDFSSPYSYLASARIEAIAAEVGATVEWVPFLLGALFKAIGTPMVPLHAFGEARRAWYRGDQVDQAAWHRVPFRFPRAFPLRTVTALRVAVAEPAVTPHLYGAAWVGDLDVGDEEVLRGVLDDAGFDGRALLDRAATPEVKDQLRANTDRALAAGVCGAPSFLVDDLLFWGQDRLDMVARALAGWRPGSG